MEYRISSMNRASSSPDSKGEEVHEKIHPTIDEAIAHLSETYADKVDLLVECNNIAAQWKEEGCTHIAPYELLNAAESPLLEEDMEDASALGFQPFTS